METTTNFTLTEAKKIDSLVDEFKKHFVVVEAPQEPRSFPEKTLADLVALKDKITQFVKVHAEHGGLSKGYEVTTIGNVFVGEWQPDHFEIKLTATITKRA